MRKRISAGLAVLLALPALALPHYGDPNQPYDRIPGTRPSPHFAWAKPLAGGKVNALVILPYNKARNVVELEQRLDLDASWIMTAGTCSRTQSYREGSIATPLFDREADLVFEKVMKERLFDRTKKYDAIVIGKVTWELFEPAEKAEILRRVREDGSGLVYFSPNRFGRCDNKTGIGGAIGAAKTASDADFEALVGAYDPVVAATILKGVPVDALPIQFTVARDEVVKFGASYGRSYMTAAEVKGWIGSAMLGKGRVVAVDYGDAQVGSPWHDAMAFVVKEPNGWFDWTVYDYAYEIAARAVLVAAGRADEMKATVEVTAPRLAPRLEWNAELAKKTMESGLWKNPPARDEVIKHPVATVWREDLPQCRVVVKGADGNAVVTLRDRDGKTVATLADGKLPALKRGDYFVCAQAKDASGAVKDFASAAFRVGTDQRVEGLKTDRKHYDPGETIRGSFALTRALKPGERVVVTARDTWGRLVYESELKSRVGVEERTDKFLSSTSTLNFNFSLPVKEPLSRMWDIFVTVKDGAGDVCDATCWVGLPDWDFDDYYAMLIFCPRPGQRGWKGELYPDLMFENGINASFSEYIYDRPDYSEHDARHHLATWAYSDHHGEIENQPELVRKGIANTNLDIKALHDMMDAYVANGGRKLDPKAWSYTQRGMNAERFNHQLDSYGYAAHFGVMGFNVTGENGLSGDAHNGGGFGKENSGFGPKTTKAFQDWCKKEYAGDLAALNAEWNTRFASWDEVKGVMLLDAFEDDQLPRWVDFRYFMRSEMWSGFFRKYHDYIRTRCPRAATGFCGHARHDFTQYRGSCMTSGKLYVSQKDNWEWLDAFECEIRQSFADDRGCWLGSQSSIRWTSDLNNRISRKRLAWAMLALGLRGFDFENGADGESFGGMAWSTADYSELLPYTKEVLEEVRVLQCGLGRLVCKGRPWRGAVAIDWSPRNHFLSGLLPGQQPRGFSGGELYNISLVDGAPNDALGLMNSLRIRPTVVAPEDVEAGLAVRGFKALVLPYNKAMGEAEAEAIRNFVANGGLVLADNEPATYTQHGKKRGERLLKDLFPDFSKTTVQEVGKGRAVYLAGLVNGYPDRMLEGDFKGSDLVARMLEELVGVVPPVRMTDEKGLAVRDVRFAEFDTGATRVLVFLRQHVGEMKNDAKTYRLDFGGEYEIYDATCASAYLGRHAFMDLEIDHYAKCLVLAPVRVKSATLTAKPAARGGRVELALAMHVPKTSVPAILPSSRPFVDCWHVEVFGPDGAERRSHRRNVMSEGLSLELSLPVALDAARGTYRVIMTSAASGVKAEATVEIR